MVKKLLVSVLLLGAFIANACATNLTKFVVFGDSLSDNGNLYAYLKKQLPPSPPYYKGRFSNGYVWVEQLAQQYYPNDWQGHILNYAFGGAGVATPSEDGSNEEDEVMFSLGREIDSYLLAHGDKADDDSLYTIWIGSNNYIASHFNPAKTAKGVIAGIKSKLERLAQRGARHILVLNLPDMGKSPAARAIFSEAELSECTALHNAGLSQLVDNLKQTYPAVDWIYYDVFALFSDATQNPEQYGLTNTTDTCYQSVLSATDESLEPAKSMLMLTAKFTEKTKPCTGYMFFDGVHPTAHVHAEIAKLIKQFLDNQALNFT